MKEFTSSEIAWGLLGLNRLNPKNWQVGGSIQSILEREDLQESTRILVAGSLLPWWLLPRLAAVWALETAYGAHGKSVGVHGHRVAASVAASVVRGTMGRSVVVEGLSAFHPTMLPEYAQDPAQDLAIWTCLMVVAQEHVLPGQWLMLAWALQGVLSFKRMAGMLRGAADLLDAHNWDEVATLEAFDAGEILQQEEVEDA